MDGIYLALSITTRCNLNCFYCKPTGESISGKFGTISFEDFKSITTAAHLAGIRSFRLTGGECTLVDYFPQAILHIMKLGEDTHLNICTNGFGLSHVLDLIIEYKSRINVRISIDALSEIHKDYRFPKYLSTDIKALTRVLVSHGIKTRFNIVVTSYNIDDVPSLITEALKLKVDIKLLDLYVQDTYLSGESPDAFWDSSYQSLSQLRPFLDSISDTYIENYWDDSKYGIKMGAYIIGENTILMKDSSEGAHFSSYCETNCLLFSKCQEGIYVPFVSVGNILHINGCHNKSLSWDLSDCSVEQMVRYFEEVLKLFDNLRMNDLPSKAFRSHRTFVKKD